jgi:hypothetical protein
MVRRFSKRDLFALTLATGFLLAFAFFGAKQVLPALQEGNFRPATELYSCDLYLDLVAHRPQFAAKLSSALRALPAEKPIAIVMRDTDADSSLLGMLSAYLAWPHKVRIVRVQRETPRLSPSDYSAIIYCNVPQKPSSLPVIALSSKSGVAIASSP